MFKNLSTEALGISGQGSELIELALSHGFKGVDLDLVEFSQQAEAQGFDKASRLIRSARLKIGSFRLPLRWQDDTRYGDELARLEKLLPMARELGCTRAVTLVEPGHERLPYHENFEFHRRRLTEVAAMLGGAGVRLGLEFSAPRACRAPESLQFMQRADELLLLIRNIGADNVGVAVDTWHWHLGGGTLEVLSGLPAEKVVAVCVADAPADATAETIELQARLLPGDGAIDLSGMLSALASSGYDGPVTPTPHPSRIPVAGREAIVKQAGKTLDVIWQAAGVKRKG